MNKTVIILGFAILAIAALVAFYLAQPPKYQPSTTGFLKPGNLELVARGELIYQQSCAACHGVNLEGQDNWRSPDEDGLLPAPPHDESGHTWHHRDELLFNLTKFGSGAFVGENIKTNMPQYDGILSDEDIIAVLSYIKSTWSDEIQARHDELDKMPL